MILEITHQHKSPKTFLLLNDPYKKQNIIKQVPNPTNLCHKKMDEIYNTNKKYTSHEIFNTNKRIYQYALDNSIRI